MCVCVCMYICFCARVCACDVCGMYSNYNPDVSFALLDIWLKSVVLDYGSNRSNG